MKKDNSKTDSIIQYYQDRHEKKLRQMILETEIPSEPLKNAILYNIFPGGKRLRPLIVYTAGAIMDVNEESLDVIAVAIELIHCYSLIHDDLPAMDNDDFRRGKPSCHKAYGESTAILIGDGMQALALEFLLAKLPAFLPSSATIAVSLALLKACGFAGMVSGQYLDLREKSTSDTNESELMTIHALKTGKLIAACFEMVLNASNPSASQSYAFTACAKHLGLAFQMQDDYLDYYAEPDYLGKGRSSDKANRKITLAHFYNQEGLLIQIHKHFQVATEAISIFKNNADPLLELINTVKQRTLSKGATITE